MTDDDVTSQLLETDVLALTMWAEARGDFNQGHSSVEERLAVGCVIRNRVLAPAWWGTNYRAVCLKRAMFSCWLPGNDPNHLAVMALGQALVAGQPITDLTFLETKFLAEGIRRGLILDRTNGSDHYYAPKAMRPAGAVPKWAALPDGTARPPDCIVGDQHFYHLGASA